MPDFVSHEHPAAGREIRDAEWEIRFYEDIIKRNPNYVEVLTLLGNLYTGRKLYTKGLEVDRRLASLRQDDPIVHYNLACSYALLNQPDEAFQALFRAIELGYSDVEHMEADSDLDKVRTDPRYTEALKRARRSAERHTPET